MSEWLDIMLEEIERRRRESEQAAEEAGRRDSPADGRRGEAEPSREVRQELGRQGPARP